MKYPRLAALLAVVLWGISFVATKAALRELSPIALIFIRFAMGAVFLWAIVIARRLPLTVPRTDVSSLLLMGFIGIFVHQMLQAHALQLTSAVNTGWLIGVTPIWSALLAAFVLHERFGAAKIFGLILGFAGALLVISKGELTAATLALPSTRGDLLILASTVNWAIYTTLGHPTIRRLGSLRATAAAMLFGWLMMVPFFITAKGWRDYVGLSANGWVAVLFLGIGCSGLGYFFWYGALEQVETSRVASLLYIEPLVTFAAAVALLGERVRVMTVLGGLILLVGVILVQRSGPIERKTAPELARS